MGSIRLMEDGDSAISNPDSGFSPEATRDQKTACCKMPKQKCRSCVLMETFVVK